MAKIVKFQQSGKKNLVKQDLNFLEYPLWFQDERQGETLDTRKVWKDRDGYTYSTFHRLPTKVDGIILYYLLLRSQQEGWKERIVFSRKEILTGCGMEWGKLNRLRLKEALNCLESIRVKFEDGVFFDGNHYTVLNFHIIDAWGVDEETGLLYVRFSPEWLLRLKASVYFRFLDFNDIVAVGSPLAMRLYELLAKVFSSEEIWEIDALELAEKIPMKGVQSFNVVSKIKKAVERINERTGLTVSLEVQHPQRGKTMLVFKKVRDLTEIDVSKEQYDDLLKLLPDKEQDNKAIQKFLAYYLKNKGFDYVKRNIQYANGNARKNYRLFFQRALEKDWGKNLVENPSKKKAEKKTDLKQEKAKLAKDREKFKEDFKKILEELKAKDKTEADEVLDAFETSLPGFARALFKKSGLEDPAVQVAFKRFWEANAHRT